MRRNDRKAPGAGGTGLLIAALFWVSCGQGGPSDNSSLASAGQQGMDSIAWPMDSLSGAGMRAELKSVEISVDTGGTYLQGKALEGKSMHLDKVLEQLLVAQWQRYGSLPDTLKLHFSDDILMGGRGAVQDKIDQALEILRDTVSLSRYQMTYRKTGNNQKARLRREYPLLFPRKAGY